MKILILVAHPDDEVLGCGGTIAKLSKNNDVNILILGEGITSRENYNEESKKELIQLEETAIKVSNLLGARNVFFERLPDNKFDTIPLLDIIKRIEKHLNKIEPDVIFTHHFGDLNIDHQITHKAVLTATRPIHKKIPYKIISFENSSSTEWNFQNQNAIFIPNYYVNIEETINTKLEALSFYKSEIREYPHPRSIKALKILAQKRGIEVGLQFAEAFCIIREIEK